jgi:NNP family nitrate/nitrite transporter-like MFS transporter
MMTDITESQRQRVLWLSTIAFTLLFAVWLMLGVLGIPIQKELNLTDAQLAWLGAAAILAGSIGRLQFGIWADRYGGRRMFLLLLLLTALPTFWVSQVHSFGELLACALLFGLAGNSFTAGIAWCAAWFPRERQGTALGIFGAGNVGASGTKFIGPALIAVVPAAGFLGGWIPGGWRFVPIVYTVLLLLMALAVWLWAPLPDRTPGKGRSLGEMLAPLKHVRAWQFSLDYVVVFGAYVALSVALPKYYVSVYEQPLWLAALLTALFIFPASLLRPLGGYLSDRFGPRVVWMSVLLGMLLTGIVLSLPSGDYVIHGHGGSVLYTIPVRLNVGSFTLFVFLLGCGMGIGKAAVYKYIPEFFPSDVGAVGGLVGMLGALGGFVLPPTFVALQDATGLPQTTFLVILLLTVASLCWHLGTRAPVLHTVPTPTSQEVVDRTAGKNADGTGILADRLGVVGTIAENG